MQLSLAHQPFVAASGVPQRRSAAKRLHARRGQLQLARAEPFNEGAAQVRRLVDRDRKELDLDELEATFAEDPTAVSAAPSSAAEASSSSAAAAAAAPAAAAGAATPRSPFQATPSAADKTFVSPFGPSSSSSNASPFGASSATKRPFTEPAGLSPNMPTPKQDTTPWWTKITLTQIVIVMSFTTIISLMIGTFFFVLGTGAIRFNE